jgi:hypothetical protein
MSIAAAAWQLGAPNECAAGAEADRRPIVMVSPALDVRAATIPEDGLSHDPIDPDGLPLLADARTWPLEIEPD